MTPKIITLRQHIQFTRQIVQELRQETVADTHDISTVNQPLSQTFRELLFIM